MRPRPLLVVVWRDALFPRQAVAASPKGRDDERPTPEATLVLARHDLKTVHAFVIRNRPPVAYHLYGQIGFADERGRAVHLLASGVVPVDDTRHATTVDQLPKELGRVLTARVELA